MGKIQDKKNRLKSPFKDADESQKELVDSLIGEATFMKAELDNLKKQIKAYGAATVKGTT